MARKRRGKRSKKLVQEYACLLRDWEMPINLNYSARQLCELRQMNPDDFMDWISEEPVRRAKFVEVQQTKSAIVEQMRKGKKI